MSDGVVIQRASWTLEGGARGNGFSIIEMIIALTILAVGVLALAPVMVGTSSVERLARNRQEMVSVAESKFEDLRAYASSRTADTVELAVGGSLTGSVVEHADSLQGATGRWYRRRWEVVAGPAGSREVTLRVEPKPTGSTGTIDKLDFTTYLTIAQQ